MHTYIGHVFLRTNYNFLFECPSRNGNGTGLDRQRVLPNPCPYLYVYPLPVREAIHEHSIPSGSILDEYPAIHGALKIHGYNNKTSKNVQAIINTLQMISQIETKLNCLIFTYTIRRFPQPWILEMCDFRDMYIHCPSESLSCGSH